MDRRIGEYPISFPPVGIFGSAAQLQKAGLLKVLGYSKSCVVRQALTTPVIEHTRVY